MHVKVGGSEDNCVNDVKPTFATELQVNLIKHSFRHEREITFSGFLVSAHKWKGSVTDFKLVAGSLNSFHSREDTVTHSLLLLGKAILMHSLLTSMLAPFRRGQWWWKWCCWRSLWCAWWAASHILHPLLWEPDRPHPGDPGSWNLGWDESDLCSKSHSQPTKSA